MAKTLVQRLARERQKATGEKYSTCLRYVHEHLDELAPEYLRRRAEARTAAPAQRPSDPTADGEPLAVDNVVADQSARQSTAAPASARLAVVFSSAHGTPSQKST